MNKKVVSLAQIAEQLGVSISTVSRALNNHPGISDRVKEQVFQLSTELNYVPNKMAVGLKSGKRNILGVIVPLISRNFFSRVIEGIEDYAYSNGYDILICQSKDSEQLERRQVASMNGKVDGVLASIASHSGSHDYFNSLSVPLVLFDRVDSAIKASSVTVNDYKGARIAVEHLWEQGARRIYHFCGPRYINIWNDRYRGYIDALKDRGVAPSSSWIFEAPTTEEQGRNFAKEILSSTEPLPDAIFSSGDYAALGIISELKNSGVDIPIVGFANEPFCDHITPSLSSISQHGRKMGEAACKMLIDLINGEPAMDVVITPKLVVRESSLL